MDRKVLLIVLDGVGAGALPDAASYGDVGAATIAHVFAQTRVELPQLCALGMGNIPGTGLPPANRPLAAFGRCAERSAGKDTTTGHWEMAGLPLQSAFPTFPNGFPDALMKQFEREIGRGTLGNYASSGTEILDRLGVAHMQSGKPIVYTSADSVFQIAAHEQIIPLEELYAMCEKARALLTGIYGVGRVIARPFVGEAGAFRRTGNRRDFSLMPFADTMLDVLQRSDIGTMGIGKIEDIFAHRGLMHSNHAIGNAACISATLEAQRQQQDGLIFVNLVDYDMLYGHRRDPIGFARALQDFDAQLPTLIGQLGTEDLLMITADHGCDPTHRGTDHTREYIPILCYAKDRRCGVDLGIRASYADIASTILEFFGIAERLAGESFLSQIPKKK